MNMPFLDADEFLAPELVRGHGALWRADGAAA